MKQFFHSYHQMIDPYRHYNQMHYLNYSFPVSIQGLMMLCGRKSPPTGG